MSGLGWRHLATDGEHSGTDQGRDTIFQLGTATVNIMVETKCNMLHCLLYRNTQNGILYIFSWTADDDGSR